jgi:hypothetical protein
VHSVVGREREVSSKEEKDSILSFCLSYLLCTASVVFLLHFCCCSHLFCLYAQSKRAVFLLLLVPNTNCSCQFCILLGLRPYSLSLYFLTNYKTLNHAAQTQMHRTWQRANFFVYKPRIEDTKSQIMSLKVDNRLDAY